MANLHAPLLNASYPIDAAFHAALDEALAGGYVRRQRHPELPLSIYNYTPAAQYERVWTVATMAARGLVLDDDGQLVARPLPKFFNFEEVGAPRLPTEPFRVFEKVDGSLLIATRWRGTLVCATRGSFTSPQSQVGRTLTVPHSARLDEGVTYLFEVIYPQNRIVLDYGTDSKLVLLTAIETATGRELLPDEVDLDVEKAEEHDPVLIDPTTGETAERSNREGYVLRYRSGVRVKVKHAEYTRLHRILTNVSSRTLWEWLKEDRPLADLLDNVPDEFYDWVKTTSRELTGLYRQRETEARDIALQVWSQVLGADEAAQALTWADEVRNDGLARRPVTEAVAAALDELTTSDYAGTSLVQRVERWQATKNPTRKADHRDTVTAPLRDPAQLDRAVELVAEYLQVTEAQQQEHRLLADPLREFTGAHRRELYPHVRQLDKELQGLVWAVIDGTPYDRAIWDATRPSMSSPFADRIAA